MQCVKSFDSRIKKDLHENRKCNIAVLSAILLLVQKIDSSCIEVDFCCPGTNYTCYNSKADCYCYEACIESRNCCPDYEELCRIKDTVAVSVATDSDLTSEDASHFQTTTQTAFVPDRTIEEVTTFFEVSKTATSTNANTENAESFVEITQPKATSDKGSIEATTFFETKQTSASSSMQDGKTASETTQPVLSNTPVFNDRTFVETSQPTEAWDIPSGEFATSVEVSHYTLDTTVFDKAIFNTTSQTIASDLFSGVTTSTSSDIPVSFNDRTFGDIRHSTAAWDLFSGDRTTSVETPGLKTSPDAITENVTTFVETTRSNKVTKSTLTFESDSNASRIDMTISETTSFTAASTPMQAKTIAKKITENTVTENKCDDPNRCSKFATCIALRNGNSCRCWDDCEDLNVIDPGTVCTCTDTTREKTAATLQVTQTTTSTNEKTENAESFVDTTQPEEVSDRGSMQTTTFVKTNQTSAPLSLQDVQTATKTTQPIPTNSPLFNDTTFVETGRPTEAWDLISGNFASSIETTQDTTSDTTVFDDAIFIKTSQSTEASDLIFGYTTDATSNIPVSFKDTTSVNFRQSTAAWDLFSGDSTTSVETPVLKTSPDTITENVTTFVETAESAKVSETTSTFDTDSDASTEDMRTSETTSFTTASDMTTSETSSFTAASASTTGPSTPIQAKTITDMITASTVEQNECNSPNTCSEFATCIALENGNICRCWEGCEDLNVADPGTMCSCADTTTEKTLANFEVTQTKTTTNAKTENAESFINTTKPEAVSDMGSLETTTFVENNQTSASSFMQDVQTATETTQSIPSNTPVFNETTLVETIRPTQAWDLISGDFATSVETTQSTSPDTTVFNDANFIKTSQSMVTSDLISGFTTITTSAKPISIKETTFGSFRQSTAAWDLFSGDSTTSVEIPENKTSSDTITENVFTFIGTTRSIEVTETISTFESGFDASTVDMTISETSSSTTASDSTTRPSTLMQAKTIAETITANTAAENKCDSANRCSEFATCITSENENSCRCWDGCEDLNVTDPGTVCRCTGVKRFTFTYTSNSCSEDDNCAQEAETTFQKYCEAAEDKLCTNYRFIDFDECSYPNGESEHNNCSVNARCINTYGSYTCECKSSYIDIDLAVPGRNCTKKQSSDNSMSITENV